MPRIVVPFDRQSHDQSTRIGCQNGRANGARRRNAHAPEIGTRMRSSSGDADRCCSSASAVIAAKKLYYNSNESNGFHGFFEYYSNTLQALKWSHYYFYNTDNKARKTNNY